jgi:hypothetical protein
MHYFAQLNSFMPRARSTTNGPFYFVGCHYSLEFGPFRCRDKEIHLPKLFVMLAHFISFNALACHTMVFLRILSTSVVTSSADAFLLPLSLLWWMFCCQRRYSSPADAFAVASLFSSGWFAAIVCLT